MFQGEAGVRGLKGNKGEKVGKFHARLSLGWVSIQLVLH